VNRCLDEALFARLVEFDDDFPADRAMPASLA